MKSAGRPPHVVASCRNYAGRRTLERIYRRIASSNVVGTLTRVGRAHRSRYQHRATPAAHEARPSSLHPQGSVLQKRTYQQNQLRLERAKSRRRAREHRLKKVWEDDALSSGSEEVIQDGCTTVAQHPTVRLVRSFDDELDHHHRHSLPCSDESSSTAMTDITSSLQYLAGVHRSKKEKGGGGGGCTSPGYIPQLFCALILSLGNLNIGYSLAYHGLAPANHLPADAPSWLLPWTQNLFNLGGLLGGLISSFALAKGRKLPLIFFILVSTGSWLMVILAHSSSMIFGARLIAGVTAGVVTVLNQVYIAELVSPLHRGSLSVLPTCFGLMGTLACFGLSQLLPWHGVSVAGAAANAPYLLLVVFYLPDSTRFLIKSGRIQAAADGMEKLGTTGQLPGIRDAVEIFKMGGDYSLFGKPFLIPVITTAGLMFFSQFAGVDGVLSYVSDRFRDRSSVIRSSSNVPVVVLYCVQLTAAFVCFFCINGRGRRRSLLLTSAASSAVALLGLGLYLLFEDIGRPLGMRWIPMACVIVYSGAYALGLGPIPWLILGEFSPRKNQGAAAAVAATSFWAPSLIITISFGDMQSAMYLSGTFWFYTIFCVFGYLFVLLILPHFRPDATLEEIQLFFLAKDPDAAVALNKASSRSNGLPEDPWSFGPPV